MVGTIPLERGDLALLIAAGAITAMHATLICIKSAVIRSYHYRTEWRAITARTENLAWRVRRRRRYLRRTMRCHKLSIDGSEDQAEARFLRSDREEVYVISWMTVMGPRTHRFCESKLVSATDVRGA